MADSYYRKDKEIMLVVVGQNGQMLHEAGDNLKRDPDVVQVDVHIYRVYHRSRQPILYM